jgi:hypothetical protein
MSALESWEIPVPHRALVEGARPIIAGRLWRCLREIYLRWSWCIESK